MSKANLNLLTKMVNIVFNVKDPNNPNENKIRRKRRSKNELDGRSYVCSHCGKKYLSQPALTNHKKSKHNYDTEGEKKGRGRPRKNVNIFVIITIITI